MKKISIIIFALLGLIGLVVFLKPKEKIGYGGAIDGAEHKQKHCIGIMVREKVFINAPDAEYGIYCKGLTYGQSFTF